jgi:hypothetical protein
MSQLTVMTRLLYAEPSEPLTSAERVLAWELCALLDEQRTPANTEDPVWVTVEAARLRGLAGRDDNQHLIRCLAKLARVQFRGENPDGTRWLAQLIAQADVSRDRVRLLIPPRAVTFLRAPGTFAKIDAEAVYHLPPNARTLYALLSDRFRQKHREWIVDLDTLKSALGLAGRYARFNSFRERVLDPTKEAINDFGAVNISWEPVKLGRGVHSIRFTWSFKSPNEVDETAKENHRHSIARRKVQETTDAPPLIAEDALKWWVSLDISTKDAFAEKYGFGVKDRSETTMIAAFEAEFHSGTRKKDRDKKNA